VTLFRSRIFSTPHFLLLVSSIFVITGLASHVHGQDAVPPILPFTPIEGTLAAGVSAAYRFNAPLGAVISLRASTPDSDLDAALTVTDSSGRIIGAHDDRAYPDDLDPLLAVVTLPRTDTYTVTVASVGGTTGTYTLALTPGFAEVVQLGFTDEWSGTGGRINATPDRIIVTAEGARARTYAHSASVTESADFFAQVDVIAISSQADTWIAGIAFRRAATSDTHYLYSVNEQGLWRFSQITGVDERVIRDWTPHPALVAGDAAYTLSVLAIESSFDFFYDGTFIGTNADDALARPGSFGVIGGTSSPLSTINEITYANWSVTAPDADSPPIPDQIFVSADGMAMATALRRQFPALSGGTMGLTLPESSVQFNRAGVNRIGVGRGALYSDFALGVMVALDAGALVPAGCGVTLRGSGDDNYTLAYFNREGEYGLSGREGDVFSPGAYGARAPFTADEHHLLIIASANTLLYYLDGAFAGAQTDDSDAGELGVAVVNFEPTNTTCRASNLWVWVG